MLNWIKRHWRLFSAPPPGKRFRASFDRRRQERPGSFHKKILAIGTGVIIMGLGLVMLIAPGPGILFLAVGAMLIAQESLSAARTLDWADIRLRRLAVRARNAWWRWR